MSDEKTDMNAMIRRAAGLTDDREQEQQTESEQQQESVGGKADAGAGLDGIRLGEGMNEILRRAYFRA
jgi:hypothetical protein